jgi:protein gp37
VKFFFKQWGEFGTTYSRSAYTPASHREPKSVYPWGDGIYSPRVGKKAAGRLLDGREWNEMPEASHAR